MGATGIEILHILAVGLLTFFRKIIIVGYRYWGVWLCGVFFIHAAPVAVERIFKNDESAFLGFCSALVSHGALKRAYLQNVLS